MNTYLDQQAQALYEKARNILKTAQDDPAKIVPDQDFSDEFFALVDKVNLSLIEDKDNFYGFFLLRMSRKIRFDISAPTAVNFQEAKYVIYFNPLIFLELNFKQMESMLKHEILHIVSLHHLRAKEFKTRYNPMAVNMAMDIVVNSYLNNLPPYATTLYRVNLAFSLELIPFETFEYYVEKLQTVFNLMDPEPNDEHSEDSHKIWEESAEIDGKTLQELTEKLIDDSQKGSVPQYLENLIAAFKNKGHEIPWNIYLRKIMGIIAGNYKKTVTRRNRRQPERLDLKGRLRSHQAKIAVALDISGSISDEEFYQAINEVFSIVNNYKHEITIIECDSEIRRAYQVSSPKDIKKRLNIKGATKFSPVFEYANKNRFNLLIYFTDGQGEEKLATIPRGYKTLWVISGRGEKLSLSQPYGAVKKLPNIDLKSDTVTMTDVRSGGYSMHDQERIPF